MRGGLSGITSFPAASSCAVGHAGRATRRLTFFFPLLEFAAAMALASFDFCSLGACKPWDNRTLSDQLNSRRHAQLGRAQHNHAPFCYSKKDRSSWCVALLRASPLLARGRAGGLCSRITGPGALSQSLPLPPASPLSIIRFGPPLEPSVRGVVCAGRPGWAASRRDALGDDGATVFGWPAQIWRVPAPSAGHYLHSQ